MTEFQYISIIVIGYNESNNLHQTFKSIKAINYPQELVELIYVDSGSQDNSVEIASQYTDKIFIEDINPTAARNRNRGAKEAIHDIVHFLDGDVEMHPEYLINAIKIINDGIAEAVCGKLIEKNQNQISKILSSTWNSRIEGYVSATHAGGTYVKKAFLSCGGYNPEIRLGEETELAERFNNAGFKAYFMENIMGYHDYGINNLWQYFKKQIGDGKTKTNLAYYQGTNGDFLKSNYKMSISNIVQITTLVTLLLIFTINGEYLFSLLLLSFFLLFPFIKLLYKTNYTLGYLVLQHYAKPFVFYGQLVEYLKIKLQRK